MSTPQPTPSTSSSSAAAPPPAAGGKRLNYRQQLAETYKNSLPIVPPSLPPPPPPLPTTVLAALSQTYFNGNKQDLKGKAVQEIDNPKCVGIWDSFTGSVWVKGKRDGEILWTRGNFGKGSLSRSEPSWWKRTVRELTGLGNVLSSEEITALRRQERKDFKIARAAAAVATVEAQERALLASQAAALLSSSSETISTTFQPDEVIMPKRPGNAIYQVPASESNKTDAQLNAEEQEKRRLRIEEETEDLEHMQLTPEEVWFLAWGLDCLIVLDAKTKTPIPLPTLFHLLTCPILTPTPSLGLLQPSFPAPRPDNPLLVNYAVYHHYRSLGWVVKPGIKFCVDWLLYKRGVVFSHAEFAVCVIPTYSNPLDYETSPHREELANVERMNWAWFSTINRVNSQVKKTLVLCYITIPSCSDDEPAFCGGDPESWSRFEIREVVLRRFVPSRMRD
ncbi:hypothetical protein BDY24DRAFT_401516 [Mrakia frigida]|uniref:tRNA splicing endonuclease subunit SEN2 n=1 Tax=Mrakia frigida TaxID=29902 RepID=UPI003FCBF619